MTITPDVRLEYLEGVASLILRFKPDKWSKLIGAEENMVLFTEFFEKPDVLVLVLTLSPAGVIIPCLGFPAALKSKGVYFIKKGPENISKDNYKDRLLYGDIGPAPVDQLIATVEEVGAKRACAGLGAEGSGGTVSVSHTCGEWPRALLLRGWPPGHSVNLPGSLSEMQEPGPCPPWCGDRPPGGAVHPRAERPQLAPGPPSISLGPQMHWVRPTGSQGVDHLSTRRCASQF